MPVFSTSRVSLLVSERRARKPDGIAQVSSNGAAGKLNTREYEWLKT